MSFFGSTNGFFTTVAPRVPSVVDTRSLVPILAWSIPKSAYPMFFSSRGEYVSEVTWPTFRPSAWTSQYSGIHAPSGAPSTSIPTSLRFTPSFLIRPIAPSEVRRIEAGILNYSSDIMLDNNPYEVGLGWTVDEDKTADYLGKAALGRMSY